MSLSSGSRLGLYEIVGPLGAGGMGEVYRARDTRLGRSVAIKVLPDAFARDHERIARFEREAKALAALNHQHIATLHGLQDVDGRHLLVMELVEGETLADRLRRGPLPVEDALRIARQIAEALEAAHEKGIVHRDLKPANVKITPDDQVKVLDFGLAKAVEHAPASTDLGQSPTMSMMATAAGIILGTAAYMSPEQAKGLPTDHRSDVFSFGCVLYEMLTGRQTFRGDSSADILASVLARDPDYSALPPDLDPRIQRLLQRCLERSRRQRWQAIGDVRAELEVIAAEPRRPAPALAETAHRPRWQWAVPVVIVTTVIVSALQFVATRWLEPRPLDPPVVRFPILFPPSVVFTNPNRPAIAISPDGAQMVFALENRLYSKALADVDVRPLPGSEGFTAVNNPAFSPDGRHVAFWATSDNTIKRIPAGGGAALTICATNQPYGLTWVGDSIIFSRATKILRVPASGGSPQELVTLDPSEIGYGPQMLPDGETLLLTIGRSGLDWAEAPLVAYSLRSRTRSVVLERAADGRYLDTGHLLFARFGVLYAVRFDPQRVQATGAPVPIVEGVRRAMSATTAAAHYAVSASGTLVYSPGPASSGSPYVRLALFGQDGAASPLALQRGAYTEPRVSPDGRFIAFATAEAAESNLWVYSLADKSASRRLTFGGQNRFPVWSSDSSRIVFQSDRDGSPGLFMVRADGAGVLERVTSAEAKKSHVPQSWSRDGASLLFDESVDGIRTVHLYSVKDKATQPYGNIQSDVPTGAAFSPDGKWVLYTSRPSPASRAAVFVQPFPATGARYQISSTADDGHHAVWSSDMKHIFYTPGPGTRLSRVQIVTAPTFSFSEPETILRQFTNTPPTLERNYDLMADGRFVGLAAEETAAGPPSGAAFHVIVNWSSELKARLK